MKIFKFLRLGNQRGEIATLLTVLSLAVMLAGVGAGTFAAQKARTNTQSKAQETTDEILPPSPPASDETPIQTPDNPVQPDNNGVFIYQGTWNTVDGATVGHNFHAPILVKNPSSIPITVSVPVNNEEVVLELNQYGYYDFNWTPTDPITQTFTISAKDDSGNVLSTTTLEIPVSDTNSGSSGGGTSGIGTPNDNTDSSTKDTNGQPELPSIFSINTDLNSLGNATVHQPFTVPIRITNPDDISFNLEISQPNPKLDDMQVSNEHYGVSGWYFTWTPSSPNSDGQSITITARRALDPFDVLATTTFSPPVNNAIKSSYRLSMDLEDHSENAVLNTPYTFRVVAKEAPPDYKFPVRWEFENYLNPNDPGNTQIQYPRIIVSDPECLKMAGNDLDGKRNVNGLCDKICCNSDSQCGPSGVCSTDTSISDSVCNSQKTCLGKNYDYNITISWLRMIFPDFTIKKAVYNGFNTISVDKVMKAWIIYDYPGGGTVKTQRAKIYYDGKSAEIQFLPLKIDRFYFESNKDNFFHFTGLAVGTVKNQNLLVCAKSKPLEVNLKHYSTTDINLSYPYRSIDQWDYEWQPCDNNIPGMENTEIKDLISQMQTGQDYNHATTQYTTGQTDISALSAFISGLKSKKNVGLSVLSCDPKKGCK